MIAQTQTPIQTVVNSAPNIIKEAATSNLGIFALMLLIIAVLAYVFFYKEGNKVKVPVFAALLIGAVSFGVALMRQASSPTYFIAGHISDSSNSDPLDQVEVKLSWGPSSQTRYSDSDGKYSFLVTPDSKKVPPQLTLYAVKDGYKNYVRTVDDPFYRMPQDIKLHALTVEPNAAVVPAATHLQPQACANLSALKSQETKDKTQIQFHNGRAETVQVFWLDYDHHEQFWFEMATDALTPQDTYVSHGWVVRDVKGKCLDVFIPTSTTPTLADIV